MAEQVDGTAAAKFCQFCGHQLTPKGKFCGKCGKPRPVEVVIPPVVQTPEPVAPEPELPAPVIEPEPEPVVAEVATPAEPAEEATHLVVPGNVMPDPIEEANVAEPEIIAESVKPVVKKAPAKKVVVKKTTTTAPKKVVVKEVEDSTQDATPVVENEKEPEELAGYVPTKAAGNVRTSHLADEEEAINTTNLHDEILGEGKKSSRAPLIVGLIGLAVAVIAIGVSTSHNSSTDLSAQSPSGAVASDVPQPAPSNSDAPSKPTPSPTKSVNAACVINDRTVSDLVDYANLARSVPGGSNDKNNAPVIVQWAQDASSLAGSISSDANRSSGKVVSSLRKAASDLNSLGALALSWGQNNVTDSNFVNDYSNGKDSIQSDYRQIASVCSGKVPGL